MGIQNWSDDIILVNIAPEPQMSEELNTVIEIVREHSENNVVVDFLNVEIVTSSNLAKLLKLRKMLTESGKKLVLCGMSVRTKAIFLVTGLENVFEFVEDQFTALAGLQIEKV